MIHFKVNFRDFFLLLIALITIMLSVWFTHYVGKQHGSSLPKYIPSGTFGEQQRQK